MRIREVQEAVEKFNELCSACGLYGSENCSKCLIEDARQATILEAMLAIKEARVS